MSEKMTRIRVAGAKNSNCGFMEWGEKTRPEMVKELRSYADYLREAVAAIDATSDADFEIDIVRGSIVQHHIRRVE
jgi:hypothetical protein